MRKLLVFAALLLALPPQTSRVPVVLISIDGLMPDQLLNPDRHGLKIPNLRRLVAEGTSASGVKGVLPTVTYPSHTTIISGVSPAKHNILANTPFDPFGKKSRGEATTEPRRHRGRTPVNRQILFVSGSSASVSPWLCGCHPRLN